MNGSLDKKEPIDDPEIGPANPTLKTTTTSEAAKEPDEDGRAHLRE